MKTSKTQLLIMLSIFAAYLIIIIGFSTNWFKSSFNMEPYFVLWLTAAFAFISLFRMTIKYFVEKEKENQQKRR